MTEEKQFCLTLDLENDWYFDEHGYDHLTLEYLDDFVDLIDSIDVPLSVFVVGKTLESHPEAVDTIDSALDAEFHLHTYQHDTSKSFEFEQEVRRGKKAFREHFGKDPVGYRAQQGNIDPDEFPVLEELGFDFDSSVFPSYRPGVYNNMTAPTEPYIPDGVSSLLEIPLGVISGIRVPTSHNYFKLLGRPLFAALSVAPLPEVLVYNIHLQDLYETKSHGMLDTPKKWIMKRNIEQAETMLEQNVSTILSRGYRPTTMTEVYNEYA